MYYKIEEVNKEIARAEAIAIARKTLFKDTLVNEIPKCFVYVKNPECTDLVVREKVVKTTVKGKTYDAFVFRSCTDKEWKEFFYEVLCVQQQIDDQSKKKTYKRIYRRF